MLAERLVLSTGKSPLGRWVTLACCMLKGMGQHTPFRVWLWGSLITPAPPFLVPACTGFSSLLPVPEVFQLFIALPLSNVDQRPAQGLEASIWSHLLCALSGSSLQCHWTGRAAVTSTHTLWLQKLWPSYSQSSRDLPFSVKHTAYSYSFPVLTEMCVQMLRSLIVSGHVYKISLRIYPVHCMCVCHLYTLCVS